MNKPIIPKSIVARWRIVWMEEWDQEYIDLVEPGYIEIDDFGDGTFQFGVVTGSFNANPENKYFDSTWEGVDEGDEVCGEIYGTL